MTKTHSLLLLPGDGIGPEIVKQAQKVLQALQDAGAFSYTTESGLIGGCAYEETGEPLPEETLTKAKRSDAVLMGAVGGPQWDALPRPKRPEQGLLGIRKGLGLFANLRPATVFDALTEASTLKPDVVRGLDILIVRELTGGIYFGQPRGIEDTPEGGRGFNTLVYTAPEVRRITEVAMELALKRGGRVCSVDKANVLEATDFWRQQVIKLHEEKYKDRIELSHMYVDNAAMQLVRNPKQFDVMVTTNMFGDILSDCAAMLTGSLGMLPSASLGAPGTPGLYEPVHGSAPDIAGKDIANPLATISSLSMLLRYSLNESACADAVDGAIAAFLAEGYRTGDIMQDGMTQIGCEQAGDLVAERVAGAVKAAA